MLDHAELMGERCRLQGHILHQQVGAVATSGMDERWPHGGWMDKSFGDAVGTEAAVLIGGAGGSVFVHTSQ